MEMIISVKKLNIDPYYRNSDNTIDINVDVVNFDDAADVISIIGIKEILDNISHKDIFEYLSIGDILSNKPLEDILKGEEYEALDVIIKNIGEEGVLDCISDSGILSKARELTINSLTNMEN